MSTSNPHIQKSQTSNPHSLGGTDEGFFGEVSVDSFGGVGEGSPLISVVMCTYNGAPYLAQQLDSILNQTYPAAEILIQDDGSTDDTLAILQHYASLHPNIRLEINQGTHGLNHNFFSAMRKSKYDYIAISDQDDIWHPRKLEQQIATIGNNLLCGTMSKPFSDDGFPVSHDNRIPEIHLLRLCYIGAIAGHTMLIHRSLLSYLPNGEECPLFYDWQLQTVAAAAQSIVYIPQPLVNFRRHAHACTATLPVGHQLMSASALRYIYITLRHHRKLQTFVRQRFQIILPLLQSLPFQNPDIKAAIRMSQLQTETGILSLAKRMIFFLRHRHHINHTKESRPLIAILRALYFPYSCGYYYRSRL